MTTWNRIAAELVHHPPTGIKVHGRYTGTDFIPIWIEIDGVPYQIGKYNHLDETYKLYLRIPAL